MSIWLTSDLHLGHQKISDMRGFTNPQEHDDAIVARWCRQVKPDHEVYILGDISAGGAAAQTHALAVLRTLPGRKILIAGNHDAVHPLHGRRSLTWVEFYRDVFEHICTDALLKKDGLKFRLNHFPFRDDHTQEMRYPEWRPTPGNFFLLHGHTHSLEARTSQRELNVGWDAWHRLINLGEIPSLVSGVPL